MKKGNHKYVSLFKKQQMKAILIIWVLPPDWSRKIDSVLITTKEKTLIKQMCFASWLQWNVLKYCVYSQIDHLQDLVRKSKQGLGSAEGLIASLQDSQERLQNELDLAKGRLKDTKDALLNVEVIS